MSSRNSLKLVPRSSGSTQETPALTILTEERPGTWPLLAAFFAFNLIVTFLVVSESDMFPARLSVSDVGKRTSGPMVARRSFTFTPDRELLRLMAEEAASRVLPVYSVRLNSWTDLWRTHITFAFRAIEDPVFLGQDDLVRTRFNELARVELDTATFRSLQDLGNSKLKNVLQTLFTNVLKDQLLVPDVEVFQKRHPNGIELLVEPHKIDNYNQPTVRRLGPDFKELLDLRRLTVLFQSEIETRFGLGDINHIHDDGRRALLKVAVALIQSHLQSRDPAGLSMNLRERPDLTTERQNEARRQVVRKPQFIHKGDVLLPAGARITLESVKIYNTMLPHLGNRLLGLLGTFVLISLFFAVTIWFSTLKFGGARGRILDFHICGGLFILFLLLVRVGWALTTGIVRQPDPVLFPALFPAAGAALLVKILIGTRLAVFFAVAMAFIATWTIGAPVQISIYYFVTGLAAAGVVTRVEHRNVLWKSGLVIALSGLFLVLTYRLVNGDLLDAETLNLCVIAVLGGLIISVLLSGLLPVLEYAGGYVTDIKLLELANTEHPLLQELREKAIGTFQHSAQVAELGFAAAKKIGANPLLVKVAAMYHDVGKTRQPKYFIENQSGEKNPHDELKPSMSALIIKNHVKDTREILERAGIPSKVISVAASHHGSTLIEYFFRRAQGLAGSGEDVPEEVYRYQGPVPQTREAGILMLEAAVRSKVKAAAITQSKDPKDQKKFDLNTIKETVQAIINTKFTDGQLDACELTLRDMRTIADSFISTLGSIHHERVSYSVGIQEKANVTRRSSSSFAVVPEIQDNEGKKDSQPHPGPPRLGKK
jgi:putative nucleotidyltransferase with HDIG domain